MTSHVHHAIDYVEINVRDLTAAQAFYAAAFGWRFNDYGPDFPGGRRFHFTDPSGNELGVWSSS